MLIFTSLQAAGLDPSPERARAWIAGFKADLPALGALPERIGRLLGPLAPSPEAAAMLDSPEARGLLQALDTRIGQALESATPLAGAGFKKLLQDCGQELGLRGRDLFVPVRVALSGATHGPELPLLFDALGVESVRQRLCAALGR